MKKSSMASVSIAVISLLLLVANLSILMQVTSMLHQMREVQAELQRDLQTVKGKVGSIESTVNKLDTMQAIRLK